MPPINLYMEDFFHIQEGTAGVVSICNNWKGTELNLLTKDKRLCDIPGRVGDTINVDIHTVDSFSISHQPASEETDSAQARLLAEKQLYKMITESLCGGELTYVKAEYAETEHGIEAVAEIGCLTEIAIPYKPSVNTE